MNRTNRRNLVKIRRLAEQAMRQSTCDSIDGSWETLSDILFEIDRCLTENRQPYTGVDEAGFTIGLLQLTP